jgi:hypothetical protein
MDGRNVCTAFLFAIKFLWRTKLKENLTHAPLSEKQQGRCPPPCPFVRAAWWHRAFWVRGAWDGVGPTPHAWVPLLKTPPPAQLLGPPPAWFIAFASPFNKCMQWHVQLCRQNARKAATHAGSTSTCAGQFAPCNVTPAKCTTRAWAWKGGRFIPSRLRCDQRPWRLYYI